MKTFYKTNHRVELELPSRLPERHHADFSIQLFEKRIHHSISSQAIYPSLQEPVSQRKQIGPTNKQTIILQTKQASMAFTHILKQFHQPH
jgi:hypothetical protein